MSYLHLTRTRTRERTPEYEPYYSLPLVHHDSSKHRRSITLSDLDDEDGHDDYPYSSNHKPVRSSRSLTVRDQPSQLERFNVWTDTRRPQNDAEDENRRRSYDTRRTYEYSSDRAASSEPDDQAFRLSINAKFSRPHSSHHHHTFSLLSPSYDPFHRSEKWWVDERWESRERSTSRERTRTRRDSFWGDSPFEEKEKETEQEKWRSYHRVGGREVERESVRPLSGWRRRRIILGDD